MRWCWWRMRRRWCGGDKPEPLALGLWLLAKTKVKTYHGVTETRRKIGGKQNQKQDQNPRTAENTEKVNSAGRTALLPMSRVKPCRSACGLRKGSGADPSALLPPRHAKNPLARRGPRYSRADEHPIHAQNRRAMRTPLQDARSLNGRFGMTRG